MISEENKKVLMHRFKSFVWRLGGYISTAVLAFIIEHLGLLNIPEVLIVITTLIVGELTKYINVNLPELKRLKEEDRNE